MIIHQTKAKITFLDKLKQPAMNPRPPRSDLKESSHQRALYVIIPLMAKDQLKYFCLYLLYVLYIYYI